MKNTCDFIQALIQDYPQLAPAQSSIEAAVAALIECYQKGGKVLVCGNGGSAADSEHIVGELMKGFLSKRKIQDEGLPKELVENLQGALPAIALTGSPALSTAFSNDVNPYFIFAQQVYGLGKEGDVLIGISTSGNAKNVSYAVQVAKHKKMKTIALTGQADSLLSQSCDITIKAPSASTPKVQEYHLPIYHAICAAVEHAFFADGI